MATLLAEFLGVAVLLVSSSSLELPKTVRALPDLLLLCALLTGMVSLILLLLSRHYRRARPPSLVTAFSAVVALAPLLVCVFYSIR